MISTTVAKICSERRRPEVNEYELYLHNLNQNELRNEVETVFNNPEVHWNGLSSSMGVLALDKATLWHEGQTRVSGNGSRESYINHPMRNMLRAYSWGIVDAEILMAVLLHDVVEDCSDKVVRVAGNDVEKMRKEAVMVLESMCSSRVSYLVSAVTNPLADGNLSKKDKRQQYVDHVSSVVDDPNVFVVKCADFIDNAGSLSESFDSSKPDMFEHLYLKYAPVLEVLSKSLRDLDNFFSQEQFNAINDSLEFAEKSLLATKKKLLNLGVSLP